MGLKTCGNCRYSVPLLTSKGEELACFCPESIKQFGMVFKTDNCPEWHEDVEDTENGV